jgi:hypothetical protein
VTENMTCQDQRHSKTRNTCSITLISSCTVAAVQIMIILITNDYSVRILSMTLRRLLYTKLEILGKERENRNVLRRV